MWIFLHKQLTGNYPTEDKRSKFLAIPVGNGNGPIDEFRYSKPGVWFWGNGPETGYVNPYMFDPLFMRGARALGIPAFYENKVLGGTTGQAFESAQRESMNTLAHPFLGPEPRAAAAAAFGIEAYLTSLRDRSGEFKPSFMPAIPTKTEPGLPTVGRRALAATLELNAFSQALGDVAGVHGEQKEDTGKSAALLSVINMSVLGTGAVGAASNQDQKAKNIAIQEKSIERAQEGIPVRHRRTGTR
jgi:hypothetical protein